MTNQRESDDGADPPLTTLHQTALSESKVAAEAPAKQLEEVESKLDASEVRMRMGRAAEHE